jgi:hypothetical protein
MGFMVYDINDIHGQINNPTKTLSGGQVMPFMP